MIKKKNLRGNFWELLDELLIRILSVIIDQVIRLWNDIIFSTSSLALLPGPLWPGVVMPVRVPFWAQIVLDNKTDTEKK